MRGVCVLLLVSLLRPEHALGRQCCVCMGVGDLNQCPLTSGEDESPVCYKAWSGSGIKITHKGCASSCEVVSKTSTGSAGMDPLGRDEGHRAPQAGPGLGALVTQLLLSLVPPLLCTLL